MTNEEKLKANKAAAKLMGREFKSVAMGDGDYVCTTNIFTNPSDCLDVVIEISNHIVSFEKDVDGWFFWQNGMMTTEPNLNISFQEAVGAAVLEVMKDE